MVLGKRTIPFLFFMLIALSGRAGAFEEKYGIGVVEIFPYNFFSMDFWKGPSIEQPFVYDEINFYLDSSSRVLKYTFSTTGSDSIPAWFDPHVFSFSKERKKFQLICVTKDGDWCEVIANKKTGMTKWVELGFDVTFSEWQNFFPSASRIEIVKGDSLLFEKPIDGSQTTAINLNYDHSYIQVMHCKEVQGMWMSVVIEEKDEFGKVINTRTGWIKWRDENEMLVEYFV